MPGLRYRRHVARYEARVGSNDLHDDRRDVVYSAIVVRFGDHRVHDSLRRCSRAEELQKPTIVDHPREPVAREKKNVAHFCIAWNHVWLDVARHPDAACDHVALGMMTGLLRRDQTSIHLLLHERVILRQLLHLAITHEIDPRIADVTD